MSQVLVVDDDRAARFALGKRLECSGLKTLEAECGHEAIRQFHANRPRVVLLDASMPDLSGFEVCRYIRAADPDRNTTVFFLTGASTPHPEYVKRCAEVSDADGYFRKPFDYAELLGALNSAISSCEPAEASA